MRTLTGDMIVDWYMELAECRSVPQATRYFARSMLTAFALRDPGQTVKDVLGKPN